MRKSGCDEKEDVPEEVTWAKKKKKILPSKVPLGDISQH